MLQPAPPSLPHSCRTVPNTARSTAKLAKQNTAAEHRPTINASSSKVISARTRREQLLAYHVAVRLLEESGVRQPKNVDENTPFSRPESREVAAFFDSSSSTPLMGQHQRQFLDGRMERVLRAVEAYEADHNRTLHDTIALDFIDAQGNLLASPSAVPTPRVSNTTTPRAAAAGVPRSGHADKTVSHPAVQGIFQSNAFSYFDSKRNEIRKDRPDSFAGSLPPCTDQALARMLQSTAQSTADQGSAGPRSLPQLHMSGLLGSSVTQQASSLNEAKLQSGESDEVRNERVASCIREAVAAHMEATAGGSLRYRRRRHSEACQRGQSSANFVSPQRTTKRNVASAGSAVEEDDENAHHFCTLEEWLNHHRALRDAVRSMVDLIVFVLMKALPVCLFAGDTDRFQQLMAEEQAAYFAAAQLKEEFLKQLPQTPPPPFGLMKDQRPPTAPTLSVGTAPLKDLDDCTSPSGFSLDALAISEASEQQIANLQLKTSQRTERSLSTIHANRLFLLIEVEQSMIGNRVSRFLDGLPQVCLGGPIDELAASIRAGRMSPSRASAGSGSPRKVEKIELERERRKREAMRPPRDPLQAVASNCHYWLSLTTARLRQLPFHACRDQATPIAVLSVADAPQGSASDPFHASVGSQILDSASSRPPHLKALGRPPSGPVGLRTSSSAALSHKSSDTGDELYKDNAHDTNHAHASEARSANRRHTNRGNDDNGFAHPEPTILPVVDLIAVLNDPANYEASPGTEAEPSNSASKLQDAVGPVELRLLLEVSTSYAALVQSLHGAETGTSYARFLERNRDRLMRAAADIIVAASVEYLDHVIGDDEGRRGLPRLSRAAKAQQEGKDANDLLLGEQSNARKAVEEPWRGLLASLRPLGKKMELSKAQVNAVLASSGQNAMSGGIVVGNEHDAKRAASHLVEQNRAVLHEVLSRVKGELQFLLTGVDGRNRILEEEQIAVERQQNERRSLRKLRTTKDSNSPGPTSADGGGGGGGGHHGALFTAHRGSLRFALKGSDIVGPTNMTRFHAMLNELVGSSSEEEEIRQENAYEASDVLRPVFDWQRQNFSREKRFRRHHGQQQQQPSERLTAPAPTEDAVKKRSPESLTDVAHKKRPTDGAPTPLGITAHTAKGPTNPLNDIDLQYPWAEEIDPEVPPVVTPASSKPRKIPSLPLRTDGPNIISPALKHLTPTAASSSRANATMSRLVQRQQSLEVSMSIDPGGAHAPGSPCLVSPRRAQQAVEQLGASMSARPTGRSRFAVIVSPRAANVGQWLPLQRSDVSPPTTNTRRRSSALGHRVRSGSMASAAGSDDGQQSKLASKLSKGRQQLVSGVHRGSIFGGAVGLGALMSEKTKQNLKAGDGLSMVDLQRELITLERNRRRAGRGVSHSTGSPRPESPNVAHAPVKEAPEESVTASVVGPTAAAVVEKFKKACGGTIQHFYGAVQGEGTSWYEQGRPCAAARLQRVAAIRGVQQGRFDLTALTPIAALRLAVATAIEAHSSVQTGENVRGAPSLVYPSRPKRVAGDLVWTL